MEKGLETTKIKKKIKSSIIQENHKRIQRIDIKGYQHFKSIVNQLKVHDRIMVCFFTGDFDRHNVSWCYACNEGYKVILKKLSLLPDGSIFIVVEVGDPETFFKNDNEFRNDPYIKLTTLPKLIIWNSSKSLVGYECCNAQLVQEAFQRTYSTEQQNKIIEWWAKIKPQFIDEDTGEQDDLQTADYEIAQFNIEREIIDYKPMKCSRELKINIPVLPVASAADIQESRSITNKNTEQSKSSQNSGLKQLSTSDRLYQLDRDTSLLSQEESNFSVLEAIKKDLAYQKYYIDRLQNIEVDDDATSLKFEMPEPIEPDVEKSKATETISSALKQNIEIVEAHKSLLNKKSIEKLGKKTPRLYRLRQTLDRYENEIDLNYNEISDKKIDLDGSEQRSETTMTGINLELPQHITTEQTRKRPFSQEFYQSIDASKKKPTQDLKTKASKHRVRLLSESETDWFKSNSTMQKSILKQRKLSDNPLLNRTESISSKSSKSSLKFSSNEQIQEILNPTSSRTTQIMEEEEKVHVSTEVTTQSKKYEFDKDSLMSKDSEESLIIDEPLKVNQSSLAVEKQLKITDFSDTTFDNRSATYSALSDLDAEYDAEASLIRDGDNESDVRLLKKFAHLDNKFIRRIIEKEQIQKSTDSSFAEAENTQITAKEKLTKSIGSNKTSSSDDEDEIKHGEASSNYLPDDSQQVNEIKILSEADKKVIINTLNRINRKLIAQKVQRSDERDPQQLMYDDLIQEPHPETRELLIDYVQQNRTRLESSNQDANLDYIESTDEENEEIEALRYEIEFEMIRLLYQSKKRRRKFDFSQIKTKEILENDDDEREEET